ncbi:AraC family transcriptional regulator [Roseiconus lacunae]|uniref:AraC family transcriptional regulator n=1 Tax=Roseiconus lacunae TaxID=2605694 RepID=A0ABT7PM34_9BACT|nr:helix-turn-helix domain-containing protein [Roseiconus lacunae]MCD0457995.1 AraC family transcriptional regulator [Roseiconus lacunae]MDM4017563.1 AraC family transcriptional regulator [Roseiconus lacunae]WRQ48370.1 AraC family transcriptional regulator [Stieleria sp. HD01]
MTVEPDFVSRQTHDARRFYLNLQPQDGQPLSLVCGGVERMDPDYVVERSDFAYYVVEWVSEGRGVLTMGGKEHDLATGSLFAYGPGVPHRIVNLPPDNMRKYYLDLAGTEAADSLARLGLLNGRPVTVARPHELVELWNLIDREVRDVADHSHAICEMLVRVFLQKIQQRMVSSRAGESSEAFQTFEMTRRLIEERFLEFRTVEEVASEIGFSPIYLSRLFKRFAGSGAYRYLLRLRMNYAAELILERGLKVSAVADRLQYSDAFQFSRAFKRVYGVPPSSLSKTFLIDGGGTH